MRSSIQVSVELRERLEALKEHPRQPYEEVIEAALDASRSGATPLGRMPRRLRAALDRVVAGLRAVYGERIARIVLYGSCARGEARADSDVDLLLVLRGDVERGREIGRIVEVTYEVLLEAGVHVSVLPMAEADFLTRATPILLNVRKEGIPL